MATAMRHSYSQRVKKIARGCSASSRSISSIVSKPNISSGGETFSPLLPPPTSFHQQNNLRPILRCRYMGTWPKIKPKRIRVVTMDVTGTIVSFRGSLESHYLGTARKAGIRMDEDAPISKAFGKAYKETCDIYPCFGGDKLSAKEWWKLCVIRSLELAGATDMTDSQKEMVFQRIYSIFGSQAAYSIFPDALPFLKWARRKHLVCGILSNADERYSDSILPMLGLTDDELQFQCYSKILGVQKPEVKFFTAAMKESERWLASDDPLLPSQVLHIGNDYVKDFEGARRSGIHSVLLERYNDTELAAEWKRRGAYVFHDLVCLVEHLGRSDCQFG